MKYMILSAASLLVVCMSIELHSMEKKVGFGGIAAADEQNNETKMLEDLIRSGLRKRRGRTGGTVAAFANDSQDPDTRKFQQVLKKVFAREKKDWVEFFDTLMKGHSLETGKEKISLTAGKFIETVDNGTFKLEEHPILSSQLLDILKQYPQFESIDNVRLLKDRLTTFVSAHEAAANTGAAQDVLDLSLASQASVSQSQSAQLNQSTAQTRNLLLWLKQSYVQQPGPASKAPDIATNEDPEDLFSDEDPVSLEEQKKLEEEKKRKQEQEAVAKQKAAQESRKEFEARRLEYLAQLRKKKEEGPQKNNEESEDQDQKDQDKAEKGAGTEEGKGKANDERKPQEENPKSKNEADGEKKRRALPKNPAQVEAERKAQEELEQKKRENTEKQRKKAEGKKADKHKKAKHKKKKHEKSEPSGSSYGNKSWSFLGKTAIGAAVTASIVWAVTYWKNLWDTKKREETAQKEMKEVSKGLNDASWSPGK